MSTITSKNTFEKTLEKAGESYEQTIQVLFWQQIWGSHIVMWKDDIRNLYAYSLE